MSERREEPVIDMDERARDGMPCNYPACGCEWDAVCDDAIPAGRAALTPSPDAGAPRDD